MTEGNTSGMETENKTLERYTQETVTYTQVSATAGAACANCRWFVGSGQGGPACHIVENYPLDIEPTGICSKHEAVEVAMLENAMPEPPEMPDAMQEMSAQTEAKAAPEPHIHEEALPLYIAPTLYRCLPSELV